MRLLSRIGDDQFTLTTFTKDENVPPYAILSHTWIEGQEIIYDELIAGTGKDKAGYDKLRFCGDQATQDGLQYFWVDTCCINKATSDEVSTSINSMFRWYQRAAKCYVFLLDVAVPDTQNQHHEITWEHTFRRSRWFTRGWTLQELIAPTSVEFFCRDRRRLGDRTSLEQVIHEVTELPVEALRGQKLTEFSVDERMGWAAKRETTLQEDKAYCLFGIFGVFMPLIYGEGETHARTRLMEEIHKRLGQSTVQPQAEGTEDLKVTPNDILNGVPVAAEAPHNAYHRQHEPICLPNTRVDLLQDINDWAAGVGSPCLFWLSGLAGTGKSTVARTVAAEYARQGRLLGSFFFSRGGGDVGHANKFVTSLAVQLANNVPASRDVVCKAISQRSDITSQSLNDQWRYLILKPLSKLASTVSLSSYILVIDALDECDGENDIRAILQLFEDSESLRESRLRVFLTSRPEVPIRNGFILIPSADHQDFVLHNISPATVDHDIRLFLEEKFQALSRELNLESGWPGPEAISRLVSNAKGLFIWAATAYRFVREGRRFAAKRLNTLLTSGGKTLGTPEKHLDEIYVTVLRNCISTSYSEEEVEELQSTLSNLLGNLVILISALPVETLSKLLSIPQKEIEQTLSELHAILEIPDKPGGTLRLHHPSFRDFILDSTRSGDTAFWVEERQAHRNLAARCIQLMSQHLKQDLFGEDYDRRGGWHTQKSLPLEIRYACLYWVQHLERGNTFLCDNGAVHLFLQSHFLHWLEALGWMDNIPRASEAISSLASYASGADCPRLSELLQDMKQFVVYSKPAIEAAPLQTYVSALLFAPATSLVRKMFAHCIPKWILVQPRVEKSWGTELQKLEGHSDVVNEVVFSPDGQMIASASDDMTAKLWDATSGSEKHTLRGHSDVVTGVTFLIDGRVLASASDDCTIKLWDVRSGVELRTLAGHSDSITAVTSSPGGQSIVSSSYDGTVKIWDGRSGAERRTLKAHQGAVMAVAVSPNGQMIASASHGGIVQLWDWSSGTELRTLTSRRKWIWNISFSTDGRSLTVNPSSSYDAEVLSIAGAPYVTAGFPANTRSWVTSSANWLVWGGVNRIWLPPTARPACTAGYGHSIAIGCLSGRVVCVAFQPW